MCISNIFSKKLRITIEHAWLGLTTYAQVLDKLVERSLHPQL